MRIFMRSEEIKVNIEPLSELLNEEINAVCFVMNYVELHFNGAILRCLNNPKLSYMKQVAVFPQPNSRDALCSLIGTFVTDIKTFKEQRILLSTNKGHALEIPLGTGREGAHYVPRGPFPGGHGPMKVFD